MLDTLIHVGSSSKKIHCCSCSSQFLTLHTRTQLAREIEYRACQNRERRMLDEQRIANDPVLSKLKLTKEDRDQAFERIINGKEEILNGESLVEWSQGWDVDMQQVAANGGDHTVRGERRVIYGFNTCQHKKKKEV